MSAFTGLTTDGIAGRAAGTPGRVQQAIATASRRTGVDFSYLMGQARIESSMNPTARASTSSATGLYQFIDQSWLAIVNDHGAKYGMGWAADAIRKTGGGRYHVPDPAMRQQILDLRNHPETASVMAAELASDNRAYLEERIGRPAQPVDLYLAHFLGAGGAAKFLTTMTATPNMAAASLFPAAARANSGIFYDRQGNARSLASIRDHFAGKLARSGHGASGMTGGGAHGPGFGNDLPANARFVQPADYLRIARQQTGPSAGQGMRRAAEGAPGRETAAMTGALAGMARLAAMDALAGTGGTSGDGRLTDMNLLAALGPRAAMAGPGASMMSALATMGTGMGQTAAAGPLADGDDPSGDGTLPGISYPATAGARAAMESVAGMAGLSGHTVTSAMEMLAGLVPAAGAVHAPAGPVGDALAGQQWLAGRQTATSADAASGSGADPGTDPAPMSRAETARLAYLMLATLGR